MAIQNYIGTAKESVSCSNGCSLSWDLAHELLVEMVNGVSGSWKLCCDKFLSISELIRLASLLKDSTAVSQKELAFHVPSISQSEKMSIQRNHSTCSTFTACAVKQTRKSLYR